MSSAQTFDHIRILSYLGLPDDYSPSPSQAPIEFVVQHFHQLPPELLRHFSFVTTPRQRSTVAAVRNRRFRFALTDPPELRFTAARSQWPTLWDGRERRGQDEGREEKELVENAFLGGGSKPYVGKLGALLGDYEEEREAERVRVIRRQEAMHEEFVPEEDESSDEEDVSTVEEELEASGDSQALFQRRIRERFIYGLLEVRVTSTHHVSSY